MERYLQQLRIILSTDIAMAEHSMSCPICGSELFISGRAINCSNPKCNYSSKTASTQRVHKRDYTMFLTFAFIFIALGFISIFVIVFFSANVFFIFIPFILPIPILRKIKRRLKASKSKSG